MTRFPIIPLYVLAFSCKKVNPILISTMESHLSTKSHGVAIVSAMLVLLSLVGQCRAGRALKSFEYKALNCRKHSVLLTEFGGVGDGKTLNTKAFKTAVEHCNKYAKDGGAMLIVPPGKWLTGSFNITSHFTLYLDKEAEILASQEEKDYPIIPPLPSYGTGRDGGNRFASLIFGTNLTDVIITGGNGTINGQGRVWWDKFKQKKLKDTRPYLIEILHSQNVQISNITLRDSPSWHVHPTYCKDVIVQGVTILAPVEIVNTDGVDPDSCSNMKIEDCYIVSGDDCIAIKSGWDQYGVKYGMAMKDLVVRRLTCISPKSAVIALGSEMSGGIKNIRVEDITAINSESGVRIKTGIGRGGYVKDIYARKMTMKTMRFVFWMTGNYGSHPDDGWDRKANPNITNINYSDIEAENVTFSAKLDGIEGDKFTGICISDTKIGLTAKPKELQWDCTNVEGVTTRVSPPPCKLLPAAKTPKKCHFPEDHLPIESVKMQTCKFSGTNPGS